MNLALRLIASWFVVSIPFGVLLGKALKVLATRPSGTTVLSHEAKRGVPAHRRVLLQIATSAAATAGVGSEQGQSIFPTSKQALSRPRVVEMSGTSDAQLRVGSLRNKTTYDLRGFVSTAYREEVTSYPLSFGSQEATSGLVVIGGQVLGGNPWEWTWQQWEGMSEVGGALFIVADGPVVSSDLRADNVSDLFKPRPAGPDATFLIDGACGTYVSDDAIENDVEMSGTIRHSLFDGINSGVSIGQETGNPHAVTRIFDSVFVFRPMPNERASDGVGHAALFKQVGEGHVVMWKMPFATRKPRWTAIAFESGCPGSTRTSRWFWVPVSLADTQDQFPTV